MCNKIGRSARPKQSGVVLFVSLMLLLILSMIAVTVARMQTVEERMARNDNSRQLAEQAGEAALRSAEGTLLSVNTTNFLANANGFWYVNQSGSLPVSYLPTMTWTAANVATYSGPSLSAVPVAVQSPKIVIEEMPSVTSNGDAEGDASSPPNLFRITVLAANADGTPSVNLQSVFKTN